MCNLSGAIQRYEGYVVGSEQHECGHEGEGSHAGGGGDCGGLDRQS